MGNTIKGTKNPLLRLINPKSIWIAAKRQKYSTLQPQTQRNKRQAVDQQSDLLRGVLQHEFLRLSKLRDHTQPRSTLPLGKTTPAGLSRRNRSRDGRALSGAHRLPLERGKRPRKKKKAIKRKRKTPEKLQLELTYHYSQQKRPPTSESF